MEQSPPSDADSRSDGQEILRRLWNPKVHYRINKGPPSWARWIQSTPFHPVSLRSILPSTLSSPEWSLPFRFSDQNVVFVSHLSHSCYIPCLSDPCLITVVISGEAYTLWSSSSCCVLQPPATSSLLGPNILLSTLFWNILTVSLNVRDQISHPYKNLLTYSMVQDIMWKIVTQLVKKYPAFFMEPEGLSLCSHKPSTRHYPEPAESSSTHWSLSP